MKRRTIPVLVLSAGLVTFLAAGPAALAAGISGAFIDDDGSVHEADINGIAAAGITTGCGPGLYCPGSGVTREQMATFLARALHLPPVTSGPFTDVAGSIHAGSINAIAAAGITTGCSGTLFCPTQAVTRDQMATFLVRALELPASTAIPFTDLANTTHAADIAAIAAAGITTGCGGTSYCPFNPVTRAQMASFLTRAFELDRVYPQINLVAGIALQCSKDGLVCQSSITVPYRSRYELREGFYDTLQDPALESSSTRVEFTINGSAVSLTPLPVETVAGRRSRLFRGTFELVPGTHTLVARWYWNGFLEQTTTVSVTVRT
jgi:S-layer family protein